MDYKSSYNKFFKKLRGDKELHDELYSKAVGGDYEEMGYLQMQLLKLAGAKTEHHIVDVGCGSGRLANQLAKNGFTKYTGYDVVEDLLDFAEKKCAKKSFRFHKTDRTEIPQSKESVDIICFFSVFTHLLHEDSFKYLLSSKSVLRSGGKIIFSFLSFDEDEHWKLFDQMVSNEEPIHHNQFMSNSQIEIWAEKLGLQLERLEGGTQPYIPIDREVTLTNGAHFKDLGSLGQGVCILSKT